jgi:hypothetical protein
MLLRLMQWGVVALWVTWLAGCATPLSAQVSRFHAWSAELAGSSFAFVRPVDPGRELEQASYEGLVAAELERLGLRRAAAGQPARIQVDLSFAVQVESRPDLRPIYQDVPVYRPPWRDAAGRLHPGYWGPDPFGPRLVGHQPGLAQVQISTLRLRLLDAAAPAQPLRTVFESSARHDSGAMLALPQIAPWLVRAVFVDFPGRSGQVSDVRFDTRTGELIRRR